jgi:hypothetical protein
MSILTDIDFWKFVVPLAGAILVWFFNERRKRAWEEYEKKEKNYQDLIKSLKGFYTTWPEAERKNLKNQFIDQLNLCWLYSPDEVIQAGYRFLASVHSDQKRTDADKEAALGAFILEIRKDLLKRRIVRRTGLKPTDFHLFTST